MYDGLYEYFKVFPYDVREINKNFVLKIYLNDSSLSLVSKVTKDNRTLYQVLQYVIFPQISKYLGVAKANDIIQISNVDIILSEESEEYNTYDCNIPKLFKELNKSNILHDDVIITIYYDQDVEYKSKISVCRLIFGNKMTSILSQQNFHIGKLVFDNPSEADTEDIEEYLTYIGNRGRDIRMKVIDEPIDYNEDVRSLSSMSSN